MKNQLLVGGHVSIAGGYKEAPGRAAVIGGNALQMFSGSPRGWNFAKTTPEDAKAFREEAKKLGIEACYFHASYLVNLADDGPNGKHSVDALIAELEVAEQLGVRGSIIHLGSFKEEKKDAKDLMPTLFGKEDAPAYTKHERYPLLISNIKAILKKSPKDTLFIIEDMGMRKIGRSLNEIAQIVRDVDDPRVKVCLDTCHLHVAGYDLSTKKKLDDFLAMFDKNIGLDKLECFHFNDSRDEFGSLRDRHDNIGEGKVGKDVFKLILNHPKLKALPFLLEVPGFDDNGPDKKNINIVRSLAA
ncbi:MAG: deoxyribonuclease IV [Candidatus Taylorbacteria bacterium]|nr:deoxyribonuclease IV [Candidatus Taylorbacteria bacterium]